MRQLDLFGSLFDSPPTSGKEADSKKPDDLKDKKADGIANKNSKANADIEDVVSKNENEPSAIDEIDEKPAEVISQDLKPNGNENLEEPIVPEEKKEMTSSKNLFQNENIGVRIKPIKQEEPVETNLVIPVEKVVAKVSQPKTKGKSKKEKVKRAPQKRGRKSFKEIDAELDLVDVPEDEVLFQKQYYAISEVAKWFAVNTSLLRFWENEFDVLKPRKNRKGDRLFRPEDVKNLQLIYQLLRQKKYTIEGAKEYLKSHKKKADIQLQLSTTLKKFKGFLLELKANLQQ